MQLNTPNILTLLRIVMIPVLGLVFLLPAPWMNVFAVVIFALAAVTDWLDGYLARKLGQTSAFGAFLDPVADKLIVAVALVALVTIHASPWLAVPAAIIIGREIAVSALREWMAEIGRRASVKVNVIGKIKTVAQMVAILVLLAGHDIAGIPLQTIGLWLLYVAAALTLYSMIVYLIAAWREMQHVDSTP
ncbi:CDP-diacylglycerol--glycerol-3-phosphate 3-phosphatidyltransferase [Alkalilimnicola ehrlichii]|uniref:CDP-diacylglycerol--glycerol-3-phosphate 3-phosphatidyltransferase n=1 Tax=Alkalilimnicola ehrlichii TaxID=351052 RepID=A0A3E0X2J3_9GAMM|nr:CDP-diacylglycerol--glycerol-3-phosphate 3-phosphatidyltransferase [Alkalilimnicola ehrlichii]RFA28967.1 CDP-diacylglycerol--glycerol-3-phosphate 3-phosphatidyltransferase [Alkalilimnicola ehrlichii]RFA38603.1 CDP-diacylglycerol--glycerol-3-phosphate 3-phosphatidyltransferase [Alkalilimnicola ehrlichii]